MGLGNDVSTPDFENDVCVGSNLEGGSSTSATHSTVRVGSSLWDVRSAVR